MKIVIAPDSFKGSMKSSEVCKIIAQSYRAVLPDAIIVELPMADGGEGTTEALIQALKGEMVNLQVTAPLGELIDASYGLIDGGQTAIMEMASASGIELISVDDLDPMKATTFGTGEMIRDAIVNKKVKKIIIGIGGSATVDGGVGMAQALGYSFLDKDGSELPRGGEGVVKIHQISSKNVIPELKGVEIKVASDVTNPLSGSDGAAHVYGPQKGATPLMVEELDKGLLHLGNVLLENSMNQYPCRNHRGNRRSTTTGKGKSKKQACLQFKPTCGIESLEPGDGAAGGLGVGLRAFCNGKLTSGAELICDAVHLVDHLIDADLLITGEGATDSQTLSGKLCSVVANYAKERGVKVLLISGALKIREELFEMVDYAFSISMGEDSLDLMLENAKENLAFLATNSAKLLKESKK